MTLLNALMETCATLTQKVAHLKQDKVTQAEGQEVRKEEEIKAFWFKEVKEGVDLEDVTSVKEINTAKPEPTVFDDEEVTMTMAQTLIKMKSEKARILDEQMAKRLQDEEIEQRKPISIAQARKNTIVYLKNMAGYKIAYFKGMTYDQLRAEVKVSGSHSSQDTPTVDPKEISEEDVKNILQIVPVAEFKVEALQVKEDLDALWGLVKERFNTSVLTVDKEKALWVELKRLYEPSADDVI
uniref:Uncharacterized protein n=1 Tax=Tanacetum cinerariifolium TaxID=118510 RepID=A0A699IIC3_TANCI|nr:hypothetical protein [Tanacetum cinerariifolium]